MKNMDKDIFQYLIRVYYIRLDCYSHPIVTSCVITAEPVKYQASHKNTIELCKINIFYLRKITLSLFKKYV